MFYLNFDKQNKGEIIETGDPQEIYEHPKEVYTQKLIAAVPNSDFPST